MLFKNQNISLIIIVLLGILIVYSNKETELEKFNNTVLGVIENIKDIDIKDEYKLINFPDKENVITKNGKIKRISGKKYNEFEKGYILVYKDKTYSFKLSNGKYCASKKLTDSSINIDIFTECENYDVEYK